MVKKRPAKTGAAGDTGSFTRSGRSPGEGNGNPLHYSCLENLTDRGAWHATVHGVEESNMTEHASMQSERMISPCPMQRLPECFGAVLNL